MTIRDSIVDSLRAELVGPRPGLPFVQLNGEEVLRPEDPPRLRYGAGILFPRKLEVAVQEDDDAAATAADNSDGNGTDSNEKYSEAGATGESDSRADSRGDSQAETDNEISRANEFLPSALGLTALAHIPETLVVTVRAAQYVREDFPDYGYTNRDGNWVSTPCWLRKPIDETVPIPGEELLSDKPIVKRYPIKTVNDNSKLVLHVFARRPPSAMNGTRFITFTLVNDTRDGEKANDEKCFFQCGLLVESSDRKPCFIEYPERPVEEKPKDSEYVSSEEDSLSLLYRHRKVFAIGHGCAVDWVQEGHTVARQVRTETIPDYEIKPVLPSEFDDLDLRISALADSEPVQVIAICSRLAEEYEKWIAEQRDSIARGEIPPHLVAAANKNIDNCETCLDRVRRGVELLSKDTLVMRAFLLMNRAMAMQNLHYELASDTQKRRFWTRGNGGELRLDRPFQLPDYRNSDRQWRPFQLAFVLMSLSSIALETEMGLQERDLVDLIWFPTGGGKTEAYLGLASFTIFYRRLSDPGNGGATVLMRYTLRLLTTQQFQRAASLICASEVIRAESPHELGEEAISIGLWVGGSVTPNQEVGANTALRKLLQGEPENPFIIMSCPWCGAQMGPVDDGRRKKVKGYQTLSRPNRVRLICDDPDCHFNHGEGLPLRLIDEHIYKDPPTLVVGTVDKFALLPFYPQARSLFGMGVDGVSPPDLIIQDELHLISGPLGSMVGHYETVIDGLTRTNKQGSYVSAKIVASTATISRANEQVSALYGGRENFLFPPQGLSAGDSFFAQEREDLVGRKYVGVFASGLPSQTTTEVRTLSALLQAPASSGKDCSELDPYWTLMVYFNSIRELGHAATLLRADIPEYSNVTWQRLGWTRQWGDAYANLRRFVNKDLELTSRVQNSEITEYMDSLFEKLTNDKSSHPVDVCLATNMIQVGLDVPRLSIMAIVGQPKTTSEYIQASSRVGRSKDAPGLVVTILNPGRPRDRSHYEHFKSYHQAIYRFVEPTSVTPFAVPVTERALHALAVTLVRFWGEEDEMKSPDPAPSRELRDRITDFILSRVRAVDSDEEGRVSRKLESIFDGWEQLPPSIYGSFSIREGQVPLMYPNGTHEKEDWDGRATPTPMSMRNVDAECNARVIGEFPRLGG